ncbi:MarR family transcriptional regulator [Peribacillus sp. SI8-4]|uniref:MarR family winged helix-turn-helix transcriptional regulator n=1 Tax=Peribacillus sp. SI8-4 TaxID=3048009 RepID=UPI0025532051|nr:MarR family transcriptional regulator [Peribacillus sp. SI8-4]
MNDSSRKKIMDSFIKLMERESENDDEKLWLMQKSNHDAITELIKGMTTLMLHVLDGIGRFEPVNGITISRQLNIPKGSVSKITRKLIAKKLITAEFLPNNKKEVLYLTTPIGQELVNLHQELHKEMEKNFDDFLHKYSESELLVISAFLQDLADTTFVTLEK